ncbi:MAG: heme exporter protein CcmB [Rhodospirillales bacterium]|nr:heme exporter protein CcmB [Rhodospirillales bacterium]
MNVFLNVLARDVRLALRQGSAGTMALGFFVLVVVLFPLGVGPELNVLSRISAGVLWVAALLACLLSLDRLFQADFEDGSLDLLVLSPLPLEMMVLAKCVAHWLTSAMPLVVASPLLALLLNMDPEGLPVLVYALLLGTPALSLAGAVGAALTVGIRRGGVLLSLVVLPLYVPVLIFGVAAVDAQIQGLGAGAHLLILAAISLFAGVGAPWAAAAALRVAVE